MNKYEGSYGHMPTHLGSYPYRYGHLGGKNPLKGSNNPNPFSANENPMDLSRCTWKNHGPPKKKKKTDIGMYRNINGY